MHFVLYHMYKFVLLLLITNAYFDYLLKMYVHLFSTLSVIQRYCTIVVCPNTLMERTKMLMLAVKRTFVFSQLTFEWNISQREVTVEWNQQQSLVKFHSNCHFCSFSLNCLNLHCPIICCCNVSQQLTCSGVGLSFSPVNNRVIQECCHVLSVFVNPSYLPLIPAPAKGSDLTREGQGLLYISNIKYWLIMI